MTTALTVFHTKVADASLTNAGDFAIATGGTLGNNGNITLGSATGYSELQAIATSTWAAAGAIGSPSGKGFVLPKSVLDLEGQQIVAGNWTPTIRLQLSGSGVTGSLTADIYCRVYRLGADLTTYTLIGSMSKLAQTLTTTVTSYTFTAASLPAMNFNLGDFLYSDVWANVTANNAAGGTALVKIYACTTAGQGIATAQIVTPGYQAQSVPSPFFLALGGNRHRFGRVI